MKSCAQTMAREPFFKSPGAYSAPLAAYLYEDGLIPRLPVAGKFI